MALGALACLLAALAALSLSQRLYTTTATYSVAIAPGQADSPFSTGAGGYVDTRAQSYATLVGGEAFRRTVLERLPSADTGEAYPQIEASVREDTVLLSVTVTDSDAERALRASRVVDQQLRELVDTLDPPTADGASPVRLQVVEAPVPPQTSTGPDTVLYLVGGALLGALLGAAGAVLLARGDDVLRRADDLERLTEAPPVLGLVGARKRGQGESRAWLESFQTIYARLSYSSTSSPRSVLVTSAVHGEGKTLVASQLAAAAARTGHRVLLMGCDLRRPALGSAFSVPEGSGLAGVILDDEPVSEAIEPTGVPGLDVLPAGRPVENPLRVVRNPALAMLVRDLTATYDLVVVDAPPVLPVADAGLLASLVDTTVVVGRLRQVRLDQVDRLRDQLARAGAQVAGMVVNGVPSGELREFAADYVAPAEPPASSRRPSSGRAAAGRSSTR